MPDIFPDFPVGHKNRFRKLCKTPGCNHIQSAHKNDKDMIKRSKSRPCSKLGCNCKAFLF